MRQLNLLIFLLFPFFCFCQVPGIQWLKSYGGSKEDKANAICNTPTGGYIIAGYTYSKNGDVATHNHKDDADDLWLVNVNSSDSILWEKCYGGHSVDEANAIEPTMDSGYVVAGVSSSFDSITNPKGALDYWVIKLDKNGNKQWERAYGGNWYDYGQDIKQTSDSGYILAGYSGSNNGDVSGNHGGNDAWIVKLDRFGNIKWKKCYGGTGNDQVFKIQVLPNGDYTFIGTTDSNDGDVTGNHGKNDVWIVKINKDGNIIWQECLGGSESDFALSFKAIPWGGYVVAASSSSDDGDLKNGATAGLQDFWMVRLDDNASIAWQKQYGGNSDDVLCDVIVTTDSAFVFCGYTESNLLNTDPQRVPPNAWFYKCKSDGQKEWEKIVGGKNADYPYALIEDVNAIAFAGASYSNNADIKGNHGDYDFIAGKLAISSLPLTFLNFSGEKNQINVLLHWQTANEINTKAFIIGRSADGINFMTVGVKPAAGTSNGITSYSYNDVNALAKTSEVYYRLQEEDKDGSMHYSKTISITHDDNSGFIIMPNPVTSIIKVKLGANRSGRAAVKLADIAGKTLYSASLLINDGYLQISSASLPPGNYILNIKVKGVGHSLKIIKQ